MHSYRQNNSPEPHIGECRYNRYPLLISCLLIFPIPENLNSLNRFGTLILKEIGPLYKVLLYVHL